MSSPRVSFVIPSYNAELYVGHAIQSCLEQTHLPHEILVIDDGSKDNTRKIVEAFPSPVRYIYKENGGAASARTRGIVESTGDWIAFLDADDWCEPSRIERQLNDLMQNPAAVLSFTGFHVHNFDGSLTVNDPVDFKNLWPLMRERNLVGASTVLVKKQVLLEAGPFRDDVPGCEDWDMWVRLALVGEFRFLDEKLVNYRVLPVSLSSSSDRMLDNVATLIRDGKLLSGISGFERWWQERRIWAVQFNHAALIERDRKSPRWLLLMAKSLFQVPFASHMPPRWKSLAAGIRNMILR